MSTAPFTAQYEAAFVAEGEGEAKEYLLQTASSATGISPADIMKVANLISAGQYGEAALQAETIVLATFGGPVGMGLSALITAVAALEANDHPSPCTCPGCESTFGLPACPQGNPFTWDAIAQTLPALPFGQPYHFAGLPNTGPSNLIDHGSYDWLPNGQPDPLLPGGPGSFEEALQKAVMSSWDTEVTAPKICSTLKTIGSNGNIGYGGASLVSSIWQMAVAGAGAMLPAFVAAWNSSHEGPQRKVSAVVAAPGFVPTDAVDAAIQGSAQLGHVPVGATVSFMINGGGPTSASTKTATPPSETNNIPVGAQLVPPNSGGASKSGGGHNIVIALPAPKAKSATTSPSPSTNSGAAASPSPSTSSRTAAGAWAAGGLAAGAIAIALGAPVIAGVLAATGVAAAIGAVLRVR